MATTQNVPQTTQTVYFSSGIVSKRLVHSKMTLFRTPIFSVDIGQNDLIDDNRQAQLVALCPVTEDIF